MSVPTPRTWTDGEIVTAALLNAQIRDSLNFLLAKPLFKGTVAGSTALAANTTINWSQSMLIGGGSYSNGVYAVPVAGLYRVTLALKWNGTSTTTSGRIAVNGTNVFVGPNTAATTFGGFVCTDIVRLNANDQVTANVNVAVTVQSDAPADNTFLIVEWIGS